VDDDLTRRNEHIVTEANDPESNCDSKFLISLLQLG
jgi:hypothetical protein